MLKAMKDKVVVGTWRWEVLEEEKEGKVTFIYTRRGRHQVVS